MQFEIINFFGVNKQRTRKNHWRHSIEPLDVERALLKQSAKSSLKKLMLGLQFQIFKNPRF